MSDFAEYKYDGSQKVELSKVKTNDTGSYKTKEEAADKLKANIDIMIAEQGKLFAQGQCSLLLIFQAMDAAGKDGAISHVMSGLNPQGTDVYSFKQPSAEELSHDYLWRVNKCLPQRGKIGIFNRSYYEEVLVVRVHNLIQSQRLSQRYKEDIWDKRYRQIREYERYLYENGVLPIKFFLHISKDEQKKRLLDRIEDKAKNWKFNEADIKEREYWDDYQKYYEETINNTATPHAPWYVIPSDKKWFTRLAISQVIVKTMTGLDLKYPEISEQQAAVLEKYRKVLSE